MLFYTVWTVPYLVFVGLGTHLTLVHSDFSVGHQVALQVGDLEEPLRTHGTLVDPVRNLRVAPHVNLIQPGEQKRSQHIISYIHLTIKMSYPINDFYLH